VTSTWVLLLLLLLLVVALIVWARFRAARMRDAAANREIDALARVRAGEDPLTSKTEAEASPQTLFDAGTPTGVMPLRGGIEVAEVADIDELLRGESLAVAERARAQLEEPTNIRLGGDTLPPRPASPLAVNPPPAKPVSAKPAPAAPVPKPVSARASPMQTSARRETAVPRGAVAVAASAARISSPAPAKPPAATPGARLSDALHEADVPLRELVLAWFEARGYRSAPASPVVRPIELVLRHKNDPARAYAFVVATQRVTVDRVLNLAQQARSIGLIRVLIAADAGGAVEATSAKRGVRVMDRALLDAELRKLDLSIAAKIIAVARKRASARAAAAG